MEKKEVIAVRADEIKPKEKWVYCRVAKDNYLCFEETLFFDNKKIRLTEPILSISVDLYIALRTKNKVIVLDKNGEIVWEKKIKSPAICHRSDYIAIAKKKKLFLYNTSGSKLFSKKVKGKILSIDIGEDVFIGSEKVCMQYQIQENLSGSYTLERSLS